MQKAIDEVCPLATSLVEPHRHLGINFQNGRPQGVTIHYTAGRSLAGSIEALKQRDLNYHLIIDRDGKITQTSFLRWRVNHAGKAIWNGVSPNQTHVAVCLVSWGELEEVTDKKGETIYTAWNGSIVRDAVQRKDSFGNMSWWDSTTFIQENSLLGVLEWFVGCGINPMNICGHDEAALPKGRKRDPGGVLSLSMAQIRDRLTKTWEFRS